MFWISSSLLPVPEQIYVPQLQREVGLEENVLEGNVRAPYFWCWKNGEYQICWPQCHWHYLCALVLRFLQKACSWCVVKLCIVSQLLKFSTFSMQNLSLFAFLCRVFKNACQISHIIENWSLYRGKVNNLISWWFGFSRAK